MLWEFLFCPVHGLARFALAMPWGWLVVAYWGALHLVQRLWLRIRYGRHK